MPTGSDLRGLLKLMLRFPKLRGELQLAFGHDGPIRELAEAYDEVTQTIETMTRASAGKDTASAEFEELQAAIESDIVATFIGRDGAGQTDRNPG